MAAGGDFKPTIARPGRSVTPPSSGHDDHGRAQQSLVQEITLLHHRDDGAGRHARRVLHGHGLVIFRIEALAFGIQLPEPEFFSGGIEQLQSELETLAQLSGVRLGAVGGKLRVVLSPSLFSITRGLPPSMTATQEFVVPRSMPIILPIMALSVECSLIPRS